MTADFGNWAQVIADVSGLAEFQNATVELYQPPVDRTNPEEAIIYSGQARVIGINREVDVAAGITDNSTATKRIRVQIPRGGHDERVKQGVIVRVVDGGRNPALENLHIVVQGDVQGSNSASRTLECLATLDYEATWASS